MCCPRLRGRWELTEERINLVMAGCHYGHFFQANAFSFFGELLFHGWGRGPEVLWMVPRSHSHTWGVQDPKPRTSRGLQDGSKPGKPPGLGEGVGPGQEVRMQGPAGRPPAPCLLSGHGDHTGTQGHTWTVSVGREQTKSSDCISNGHRCGSELPGRGGKTEAAALIGH